MDKEKIIASLVDYVYEKNWSVEISDEKNFFLVLQSGDQTAKIGLILPKDADYLLCVSFVDFGNQCAYCLYSNGNFNLNQGECPQQNSVHYQWFLSLLDFITKEFNNWR